MFDLSDVLAGTGGRLIAGLDEVTFTGVAIDSRRGLKGELFVAYEGEQVDGHRFVADALARGAAGALVSRTLEDEPWASSDWTGGPIVLCGDTRNALPDLARHWRSRHELTVIGVTGSVGKTSTKELIADLLAQRFAVLRTPANLNTDIGVPLAMMQLGDDHEVAVLEMAMNDLGDIRRLARIAMPSIGVVTNVQPSHLERLGTIERIAAAKSELVEELPSDGIAILNIDDARVRAMAESTRARVVTYGLSAEAQVSGRDVRSHGLEGIDFIVRCDGREIAASAALPGAHLAHAALAAIAAALQMGFTIEDAVAALGAVPRGGRVVVTPGLRGATILDDCYNANPASMVAALDLLEQMNGRRVAVLADMLELGSFETEGHRQVGRRAAAVVDRLLTIGERARVIAEQARDSGLSTGSIESFDACSAAVERLRDEIEAGDFVLVKGSHSMRLDEVVNALRAVA